MKNSVTANTKTEVEKFTLVFPTELKFTPQWVVNLPKGWKAEIYNFKNEPVKKGGNLLKDDDGNNVFGEKWTVVIRSPSGKVSRDHRITSGRYSHYESYTEFFDLFELSMWLRQVAGILAIKKKSRSVKEVVEAEYEDDDQVDIDVE